MGKDVFPGKKSQNPYDHKCKIKAVLGMHCDRLTQESETDKSGEMDN